MSIKMLSIAITKERDVDPEKPEKYPALYHYTIVSSEGGSSSSSTLVTLDQLMKRIQEKAL